MVENHIPHSHVQEKGIVSAAPVWLFAATMFVSATLLFWIQPLFAKMVLPLLGGSPSVWNTAMVFFQAVLLAGYAYSHLLSRQCGQRSQILLHLGVLAVAVLALPIGVAHGWHPDADTPPTLWLLGLLCASIGAPFFAVATTAPLLQRWFSHTGHPHAHDPYFLYGASNLGSILALLSFPFVLEPLLSSHAQASAWTLGFAVLAVGIAVCGSMVWRRSVSLTVAPETGTRPDWWQRLSWIVYAALPSSLLLGVTTHISTDIAPAPLLWVVPLTLYLLTFVIAFARRPPIPHRFVVRITPLALMVLVATVAFREPVGVFLPLHLVVFFVITLMCHGELVRRRPRVTFLTEFYLCLSLGGVIGGACIALGAPLLFDSVFEYPLSLALAAALLPGASIRAKRGDIILALLILAVLIGGQAGATGLGYPLSSFIVYCILCCFCLGRFCPQRASARLCAVHWCHIRWRFIRLDQPWDPVAGPQLLRRLPGDRVHRSTKPQPVPRLHQPRRPTDGRQRRYQPDDLSHGFESNCRGAARHTGARCRSARRGGRSGGRCPRLLAASRG